MAINDHPHERALAMTVYDRVLSFNQFGGVLKAHTNISE